MKKSMQRKGTSIPNFSLSWRPNRKSLDQSTDSDEFKQSGTGIKRSTSVFRHSVNQNIESTSDSYQTICLGNISQTQFKSSISTQSKDWIGLENAIIDVFKGSGQVLLRTGSLASIHENVRSLLDSNIGSFVYDRYKSQMLKKGMAIIRDKINSSDDFMEGLRENWKQFYSNTLPTLDCILFKVKSKFGLTIRQTTLIGFRDEVIFKTSFEENLNKLVKEKKSIASDITHMLLVLQSIYESYPPSKNKINIETLTVLAINPYMGYKGLYLDNDNSEPFVPSREPILNSKRKSIDLIRGSRPLTMQPKQLETLNELFASAIRKKS